MLILLFDRIHFVVSTATDSCCSYTSFYLLHWSLSSHEMTLCGIQSSVLKTYSAILYTSLRETGRRIDYSTHISRHVMDVGRF